MKKKTAFPPQHASEAKTERTVKACVLKRLHHLFEEWRKWLPKVLDDTIVILVQIVIGVLAVWHILQIFRSSGPQSLA